MTYLLGLDVGQAQDYSACVVLERAQARVQDGGVRRPSPATYACRYLHRWDLGTAYPQIVADTAALLRQAPLAGACRLVLDYTGCGRPVMDMFKHAGLRPLGISIHGGDRVSQAGVDYRVPKRDLVGTVAVLLQQQRLLIAEHLPLQPVLTAELLTFKVHIDPATAHDSYSAWREKAHDDLVLALALAAWVGETQSGAGGAVRLTGY